MQYDAVQCLLEDADFQQSLVRHKTPYDSVCGISRLNATQKTWGKVRLSIHTVRRERDAEIMYIRDVGCKCIRKDCRGK